MHDPYDHEVRQELRKGLTRAFAARDRVGVLALRSALAAIDNAEAVEVDHPPVGDPHPTVAGSLTGLWAGEVTRRELSAAEVAEVVRREIAERRAAAGDYERLGRPDRAGRLRAEADVLAAYLPPEVRS